MRDKSKERAIIQTNGWLHENMEDLYLLAKELSLNQFDNASIDVFQGQYLEKSEAIEKGKNHKVLLSDLNNAVFKSSNNPRNNPNRNILVLGAGATNTAFNDVPLAKEAITQIQSRIKVDSHKFKDSSGKKSSISFDYFIKTYQSLKKGDLPSIIDIRGFWEKENKTDKYKYIENIILGHAPEDLNVHYLVSLGEKYFDEYKKLKLYTVEDLSQTFNDFETSLNILAKLFDVSTVRSQIKNLYNFRHGPTLFYQIVAHLFKNGFIDVIINFNFDEFLDQAIDDELGKDSYDYIVSDGDCRNIDELDKDGKLRQPLYIKPHGTASHKNSMRFTKDHYNELPIDMRNFLEKIISGKSMSYGIEQGEGQRKKFQFPDKKINLITVGFGMGSLEFNEILSSELPINSKIFSFYYHESGDDLKLQYEERENLIHNILEEKWKNEITGEVETKFNHDLILIGHEFFQEDNVRDTFYSHSGKFQVDNCLTPLDNCFYELYKAVQFSFKEEFRPPDIDHHLILSKLFGNRMVWNSINGMELTNRKTIYPKVYFNSSKYLKDRVIIEIIIHTARNNGFLDLTVMMSGTIGYYYNLYYNKVKQENKIENTNEAPKSIVDIVQSIYKSSDENRLKPFRINFSDDLEVDLEGRIKKALSDLSNDKLTNCELSTEIKLYLKNLFNIYYQHNQGFNYICDHFLKIRYSNSSRIRSQLRSSIPHMFEKYSINDLVSSSLHLDMLFYRDIFMEENADTLYIIADYAYQFSKFSNQIINETKLRKFRFILQWTEKNIKDIKQDEILEKNKILAEIRLFNLEKSVEQVLKSSTYSEKEIIEEQSKLLQKFKEFHGLDVEIHFLPITQHNHHLRIVENSNLSGDKRLLSGIYYYKKGLFVNINPIQIQEEKNLVFLNSLYANYKIRTERYL